MAELKQLEINTAHEIVSVRSSPTKSATSTNASFILESIVKIVGTPPIQSADRIEQSSDIITSPMPDNELDVLDAANEDPFTLETLEDLIVMHSEKNLDFILARVTTKDPDDDSRLYYSYYAAHHINKVLFRTETDKGLLHRMKAKNVLFS
jgi:hypothetical protein